MKDIATRALRPPDHVMRLAQMGRFFPNRLSFLRVLMRQLRTDAARVTRPLWEMDGNGYGRSVHAVTMGGRTYSLVAFSQPLAEADRSDRVIATAWDAAFVLFDGVPTVGDLDRLEREVPGQETARLSERELVLSRANKSTRLFTHVVDHLRGRCALDTAMLRDTGYLMRTTAVYGNGKFGLCDRAVYASRPELSAPFMAEMLTVWLIRGFSHDLVEHVGGAELPRPVKRALGIGNATGLGMAPFLVSHPLLLDAWMQVRETALARVLSQPSISRDEAEELCGLAARTARHLAAWQVPDEGAVSELETLRTDWALLTGSLTPEALARPGALADIFAQAADRGAAIEELTAAWLMEPFAPLVDGLSDCLAVPFEPRLDVTQTCAELARAIARDAAWALAPDYTTREGCAQFWYVSANKLEPRLGDRHAEEGAE
ncbi:MAG: hypothetical protein ACU0DW_04560, partial [Shimia sp.]